MASEYDQLGLPWRINHAGYVVCGKGRLVLGGYDATGTPDEREFIVRACNAYHEHVKLASKLAAAERERDEVYGLRNALLARITPLERDTANLERQCRGLKDRIASLDATIATLTEALQKIECNQAMARDIATEALTAVEEGG